MKKSTLNQINKAKALIEIANHYSKGMDTPTTYDGGTWPYYVDIEDITIGGNKNQYVYILEADKTSYSYGFEKRYNVNKVDCDINGLPALKHHLSVICKAYKKALLANWKARQYYPTNVTL